MKVVLPKEIVAVILPLLVMCSLTIPFLIEPVKKTKQKKLVEILSILWLIKPKTKVNDPNLIEEDH